MKKVCAWCKKDIEETAHADAAISHGICKNCKVNFLYKKIPLNALLDKLEKPVFAVDPAGKITTANLSAKEMLKKDFSQIEGFDGGVVMECAFSRLPQGCGKTEHCTGCTIRNTVMETFRSGKTHKDIPAYQYIQTPGGVKRMLFHITTEKTGETVLLRIDDAAEAESGDID